MARVLRGEQRPRGTSNGLLLDVRAAAKLLGITEDALRSRVKRRRIPGVVRSGGRVEFHREVLLAALAKRAKR